MKHLFRIETSYTVVCTVLVFPDSYQLDPLTILCARVTHLDGSIRCLFLSVGLKRDLLIADITKIFNLTPTRKTDHSMPFTERTWSGNFFCDR